jgi:hypothetical protein
MILHLAQDMCTRKGISPLYPFSGAKVAGSIRPCDIFDNRISRFHACHGLVLALYLVLLYTVHLPFPLLLVGGCCAIGGCIAYMVCVSEITIEREDFRDTASSGDVPLAQDAGQE